MKAGGFSNYVSGNNVGGVCGSQDWTTKKFNM